MRLSALAAYARTLGCTAEEQVSMIDYTSFKIGGPADVYITAPTEAAAAAAWLHGAAADLAARELGEYGMVPEDLLLRIPRLLP